MDFHEDDDWHDDWHDDWTDDLPLITHHDHATTVWRALLADYDPPESALFLLIVDPLGRVELSTVFDGAPDWPELDTLRGLMASLAGAAPDSRAAFLRARPGLAEETDDDRAWAMAISQAAEEHGVELWVTHRATPRGIEPVVPFDRGVA